MKLILPYFPVQCDKLDTIIKNSLRNERIRYKIRQHIRIVPSVVGILR